MTELALDSSALSRIYELPPNDRAAVITGLRAMGRIRITAVNVLEAAAHPEQAQREQKLAFYARITGDLNPIDAPNDLLRKTARAHHDGKNTIDVGSDEAMALLRQPEVIASTHDESFTWNTNRQATFRTMHEELRATYQAHFANVPADRAKNATDLVDYFCERLDEYLDILIIPFYQEASGHTITRDDARTFTKTSIAWRLFWASRIHALYTRSVQRQGYGNKTNAGQTDLESSIYLGVTDIFITADKPQYDGLTEINTLNPRKTRILWWPDLKKAFLGIHR